MTTVLWRRRLEHYLACQPWLNSGLLLVAGHMKQSKACRESCVEMIKPSDLPVALLDASLKIHGWLCSNPVQIAEHADSAQFLIRQTERNIDLVHRWLGQHSCHIDDYKAWLMCARQQGWVSSDAHLSALMDFGVQYSEYICTQLSVAPSVLACNSKYYL